jgi:hypothetical protein
MHNNIQSCAIVWILLATSSVESLVLLWACFKFKETLTRDFSELSFSIVCESIAQMIHAAKLFRIFFELDDIFNIYGLRKVSWREVNLRAAIHDVE